MFRDRSLPATPAAADVEEAGFMLFSFSSLSQHTDKMSQMYTQGLSNGETVNPFTSTPLNWII